MSDLLKLAERCEREEPSFALERQIMYAVYSVPPQHPIEGDKPKPYTTSLDAAVTLVPDDCEQWAVATKKNMPRPIVAQVNEGSWYAGATPALALCAAALRARAHGEEDK